MRVCFLTSTFHPRVGGAETYAATIAEGLLRQGHEVLVVTDGHGIDAVTELPNIAVHRIDSQQALFGSKTKILWEQMSFGLLSALEPLMKGVDIVHANSHEAAVTASMIAEHYGIPAVATFHDQSPEDSALGVGRSRLVYRWLPIDRFIVPSRFYLEKALAFGATPQRATLVYLGVDAETFKPGDQDEARKRLGLASSGPLVVCAATLKERKGIRPLLAAFARVHATRPDARLLVVGSADLVARDYADAVHADIQRLQLQGVVTIDESVKYAQMPTVFQAGDIVVQPSLAEGLGLALLEGMATGLPAVGTDITGITEIIRHGENGLLARAGDPVSLADALLHLLQEPATAQHLGRAGQDTACSSFSRGRMIAQTIATYEDVIVRRREVRS
jgi:glycosyltransferase involved in cell wall biosynthesis